MKDVYAGIDVGSTTTKVVILSADRILGARIVATGASISKSSRELYDQTLESAGLDEKDVSGAISTGYGRKRVEFRTDTVGEITANAAGARFVAPAARVRTIVDVGGQDSKVVSLDETGRVVDFAMNDKCAAGTGRFLEVMSRLLEIDLEELGKIALESAQPLQITSLCTVFAESEVVGLVSEGKKVADIVAGVHEAIALRVGALVRRVGLTEPVLFDGGAALNPGLRKALEKNLGVELIVPEDPRLVVATGAALIARKKKEETHG